MKNKSYIFAVLAVFATVFILFNSAQPAAESSESSAFFVNFLMKYIWFTDVNQLTFFVRKTAHMTEFFVQALMISMAYLYGKNKFTDRFVHVMFFGLLTACSDELLQHFVEGRSDMVTDIWIDFSGVLFAVIIYYILYLKKVRKK